MDEVAEEMSNVSAEVRDFAVGDERKDRRAAIGTFVELPTSAANGGCGDRSRIAVGSVCAWTQDSMLAEI